MHALDVLLKVYLVIVGVDVLLAWVQPVERVPRRITHVVTEPVQEGIRRVFPAVEVGDWDLSPLIMVAILTLLRVGFFV